MSSSNRRFTFQLNLALFLAFSLGLSACFKITEPISETDQSTATFTVDKVKGSSEVIDVNPTFNIPTARLFSFEACLKDRMKKKDVVGGLDFLIMGDETRIISKTEDNGCLSWSERISYSAISDSKYVVLERRIKSRNGHRGEVKLDIAVNPWMAGEGEVAVLDPRFQKVPKLVPSSSSRFALEGGDIKTSATQVQKPVLVEEARLVITENAISDKGVELSLQLTAEPEYEVTTAAGHIKRVRINQGKFLIDAKLLSVFGSGENQKRYIVSYPIGLTPTTMVSNKLAAKLNLTLPNIPTEGHLELWVRIVPDPTHKPDGLTESSGIYHLGEYHELKGTPFIRLKPEFYGKQGTAPLMNYVTGTSYNLKESDPRFIEAKYLIDKLAIRFVEYGKDTPTRREVIFTVDTCVRNPIDNRVIRATDFIIEKIEKGPDGQPVMVVPKSTGSGCFQWTDKIEHLYYIRERLMVNSVRIRNDRLGIDQKIGIAINPWDFGFTFGRDARTLEEKELNDKSYENKPKSEFFLNGFTYTTIGIDFEIDSMLNLTMYRRVIFRIDPLVLRYHSMTKGIDGIEWLRDGVYLLKLALQRNGYEDREAANEYISSVEELVQVKNNQIITPVQFEVDDVRILGSRNNILIELAPVDNDLVRPLPSGDIERLYPARPLDDLVHKDSGLEAKTFMGPIVLYMENEGKAVMAAQNVSLLKLLAETTSRSEEEAIESLKSGDGAHVEKPSDAPITATELIRRGKIEKKKKREEAKKYATLDNFLFENNLSLVSQKKNPEHDLLKALRLENVETLKEKPSPSVDELLSGEDLSFDQLRGLCHFWFNIHSPKLLPERDSPFNLDSSMMALECMRQSHFSAEPPFMLERRLHVGQIGAHRYLKGFTVNYNFGSSFGLSASEGKSYSTSSGGDMGIGAKFFGMGPSAKLWSFDYSEDSSSSSGVRVDMSGSTFLISEFINFDITLQSHRKCFSIRPNPNYFVGPKAQWSRFWSSRLTSQEKEFVVSAGYYLCTEELIREPVHINEKYYYISQHFNNGHLQDPRDRRNRPFLMELRGVRDYSTFMNMIEATPRVPEGAGADSFNEHWALHQIYPSFQYQKFSPAFPGTYTIVPPELLDR